MAIPKSDQMPDRKYIDEGLRKGTITRQIIALSALTLDHSRFQARVGDVFPGNRYPGIFMSHVKKLAAIRDSNDGAALEPIVAFYWETPKGKPRYIVADGHHRCLEARLRREEAISAYVVKVADPERAALEFATMCNRELCLGRTSADIKRAVFMLLDDEVWRGRNDSWIADHVGVKARETIDAYRDEYNKSKNLKPPETVKTRDGRETRYRKKSLQDRDVSVDPENNNQRRVYVGGKTISLGTNPDEADQKLEEIKRSRAMLTANNTFQRWACRLGISLTTKVSTPTLARYGVSGLKCDDRLLITVDLQGDKLALSQAIGNAILLKKHADPDSPHMPIIVCYLSDISEEVADLARAVGKDLDIEFLTPEEFIERFKPESVKNGDAPHINGKAE